jgi:hypothetical protein
MGINFVSDEMVEMRYQYKEEFVEESGRTNVVIAAYFPQKLFSISLANALNPGFFFMLL